MWHAWTTETGAIKFFAPKARIELAIGGRYELLFDDEAPVGLKGSDECRILSYLPTELLAFSWNAPPAFPAERDLHTVVFIWLSVEAADLTRVRLVHTGWRDGARWSEVYEYFERVAPGVGQARARLRARSRRLAGASASPGWLHSGTALAPKAAAHSARASDPIITYFLGQPNTLFEKARGDPVGFLAGAVVMGPQRKRPPSTSSSVAAAERQAASRALHTRAALS